MIQHVSFLQLKNITLNAKSMNIKSYISKVHRTLNYLDFFGRKSGCLLEGDKTALMVVPMRFHFIG